MRTFTFNNKVIEKEYNKTANLTFSSSENETILEKIEIKKNFEFDEKKEIIQGIIGGPDKAFIIKEDSLTSFNENEKKFTKILHTNTHKYSTPDSNKYIFYISKKNFTANIEEYPNIYKQLIDYKNKLAKRREVIKGARRWFDLWWERDENFFKEGAKLVWAKRTDGEKFTYTEKAMYGTANLFFVKSVKVQLKYIVGLLNSRLMYFYMKEKIKHTGDLLQLDKNQFMKIPLFVPEDTKEIENVVDDILKITSQENYDPKNPPIHQKELEAKIDEMVFDLYELTEEEREMVMKS